MIRNIPSSTPYRAIWNYDILSLMNLTLILYLRVDIDTRRNIGRRFDELVVGGISADGKNHHHSGQSITAQATREGAARKNPHVCTMANMLRDFTRMNPPVYCGSKTKEDPQDFVDEVHKILCAMGDGE